MSSACTSLATYPANNPLSGASSACLSKYRVCVFSIVHEAFLLFLSRRRQPRQRGKKKQSKTDTERECGLVQTKLREKSCLCRTRRCSPGRQTREFALVPVNTRPSPPLWVWMMHTMRCVEHRVRTATPRKDALQRNPDLCRVFSLLWPDRDRVGHCAGGGVLAALSAGLESVRVQSRGHSVWPALRRLHRCALVATVPERHSQRTQCPVVHNKSRLCAVSLWLAAAATATTADNRCTCTARCAPTGLLQSCRGVPAQPPRSLRRWNSPHTAAASNPEPTAWYTRERHATRHTLWPRVSFCDADGCRR